MRLLALDLATRAGFAEGEAGVIPPIVGAVTLKRRDEAPEDAARQLGCFLRDRIIMTRPDLIAVEHYMQPGGQPSDNVAIVHLLLHGALLSIAGCYGIPVEAPYNATVIKHFCGQVSAMPRTRGPKTAAQKREAREATKRMTNKRAIALGYLPRGSEDFDKADVCALFDFASVHFARAQPKALSFFGEAA